MIRRFCLAIFTVVACLAARPATAQPVFGDTVIVELDTVYRDVQLGNEGVLVGLRVTEKDSTADPTRLLIYLPPFSGQGLCVELVSENSLYHGRFRYTRYDSAGWQILTIPTQHGDLLRSYRTHRLAALAHLSPTCEGDPGEVLPTGWGAVPRAFLLSLFVNPQLVNEVTAEWRGMRPRLCTELDPSRAVLLRYQCDLPAPPGRPGIRQIRILQHAWGHIPPVIVNFRVPDGP